MAAAWDPADGEVEPSAPEDKTVDAAARTVPPPPSLVVNHTALAGVRGFVSNPLLVDIARQEIQQWMRKGTKGKDAGARNCKPELLAAPEHLVFPDAAM